MTSTAEEHVRLWSVLLYLPSGSCLENKVYFSLISLTPDVFCGQNYSHTVQNRLLRNLDLKGLCQSTPQAADVGVSVRSSDSTAEDFVRCVLVL